SCVLQVPGVTTLGWGRSPSWTCHLPPGSRGVSWKPTFRFACWAEATQTRERPATKARRAMGRRERVTGVVLLGGGCRGTIRYEVWGYGVARKDARVAESGSQRRESDMHKPSDDSAALPPPAPLRETPAFPWSEAPLSRRRLL